MANIIVLSPPKYHYSISKPSIISNQPSTTISQLSILELWTSLISTSHLWLLLEEPGPGNGCDSQSATAITYPWVLTFEGSGGQHLYYPILDYIDLYKVFTWMFAWAQARNGSDSSSATQCVAWERRNQGEVSRDETRIRREKTWKYDEKRRVQRRGEKNKRSES